jgi:hypothetical protein
MIRGWVKSFRDNILPLIPAQKIAEVLYCADNGRPTKDILTKSALMILQELFNLSDDEAVSRLGYDIRFAIAFGLPEISDEHTYISHRTYDYFLQKCRENDIATLIFNETTNKLIDAFKVNCEFQRLDSVHIRSNMAKRSRLGLMSTTVKKFLNTLESAEPSAFNSLPKEIIDRYLKRNSNGYSYFGSVEPNKRHYVLAEVAKDMYQLKSKFETISSIAELEEFQLLVRVFNDQCQLEPLCDNDKLPVVADGIETVSEVNPSNNHLDSEVSSTKCNNIIPIPSTHSEAPETCEVKVSLNSPKEVSPESVLSPMDSEVNPSNDHLDSEVSSTKCNDIIPSPATHSEAPEACEVKTALCRRFNLSLDKFIG